MVTLGVFQKYPNPYLDHVSSTDVLSRYVDGQGRLHSLRLMVKRVPTGLPFWIQALIPRLRPSSYVAEESVVDPSTMTMSTRSINLSNRRFMVAEERQLIKADGSS
jgi:4-amino-4-deoxychorismate lyase